MMEKNKYSGVLECSHLCYIEESKSQEYSGTLFLSMVERSKCLEVLEYSDPWMMDKSKYSGVLRYSASHDGKR